MRKWNPFLAVMALGLFMAGAATADTLELKDGRVLKGKYLGGTQAVLRFEINGEVQTFNTTDLVALTFTSNSSHTVPAAAPAPTSPSDPVATVANADQGGSVNRPTGQLLMLLMYDSVIPS